jgi:hypothetical protein
MGQKRNISTVLVGKERDNLKDLCVDGRIVLKWILQKYDRIAWTGFIWISIATSTMKVLYGTIF